MQEFLVFGAFDDGEDPGEFRTEDAVQRLGLFEDVERVAEHVGDVRLAGIGVAAELRVGAEFLVEAQQAAGEGGRDAERGTRMPVVRLSRAQARLMGAA